MRGKIAVKNEVKGVSVNIWVKIRGKEGPTKKRWGWKLGRETRERKKQ